MYVLLSILKNNIMWLAYSSFLIKSYEDLLIHIKQIIYDFVSPLNEYKTRRMVIEGYNCINFYLFECRRDMKLWNLITFSISVDLNI